MEVHSDQESFLAALTGGSYLETFDATETGVTIPPLAYSNAGFRYEVNLVEPAAGGGLRHGMPSLAFPTIHLGDDFLHGMRQRWHRARFVVQRQL